MSASANMSPLRADTFCYQWFVSVVVLATRMRIEEKIKRLMA